MKNLLFGLIAIVLFVLNGKAQNIEDSTVLITKGRVNVKEGGNEKSARSFQLLNFDTKNILSKEYYIDNHLYKDDGQKNDVKADDGIYTSVDLFPNLKEKTNINYLMKSNSFKYEKELENQISVNKWIIKIGCKIRHVRTGRTSILGVECAHVAGGCIEFYDCEVTLEYQS